MHTHFCALPFNTKGLGFISGFDSSSDAIFLPQIDPISEGILKHTSWEDSLIIDVQRNCEESNVNDVKAEP